jgi:hypothetical protein
MEEKKKRQTYFGFVRARRVSDGSIRGIINNKTVGTQYCKEQIGEMISKLLKYYLSDCPGHMTITTHKKYNEKGLRTTFLADN